MNKLLTMTFAAALLMAIAVPAADPNQRTVFVTSASFKSNLGGLTGADDKCQAEADGPTSIVPAGTYWAWLSDGTDSPDTRFTKSSHPYVLPDGTKIAEDFTDLTDGSILHAINIDPTGQPIGYQQYWTGTNADGTAYASINLTTCGAWVVDPIPAWGGMTGHTAKKTTLWSSMGTEYCSKTFRLACFQQ
jgi:hypothetical protein